MAGASLTLAMLFGVLAQQSVLAQEDGTRSFTATSGPYEITVWEDPANLSVGQMSFVVRVLNGTTGDPVPHASVLIRFTHATLVRYGRVNALSTSDSPGYYEALVNMYTPGDWRIRVDVSSSLGKASMEAPPVEVPRLRSYMSGSYVFIGVVLVLVLAGGFMWWIVRRQERRRATSPTNEGLSKEGEPEE